jgi:hypothetical protein
LARSHFFVKSQCVVGYIPFFGWLDPKKKWYLNQQNKLDPNCWLNQFGGFLGWLDPNCSLGSTSVLTARELSGAGRNQLPTHQIALELFPQHFHPVPGIN